LQHLTQEVQDLRQSLNKTAYSAASASPLEGEFEARDILKPVNNEQDFLNSELRDIERNEDQIVGDVTLVQSEVNALFRE
jgi:hypothetical protein